MSLKLLIQDIWRQKLEWDEILPTELKDVFCHITKDFADLSEFNVPRYVSDKGQDEIEVHIFADASLKAYGSAAYVRTINFATGIVTCKLLCSKSQIAPLNSKTTKITIPRLELTACLIAVRLYVFLKTNLTLNVKRYILWSDSQIALAWIASDPFKLDSYVKARVNEIRQKFDCNCWYHCAGNDNPADLITRGLNAKKLLSCSLWLHGPDWLSDFNLNLRKEIENRYDNISTCFISSSDNSVNEAIMDLNRYSKISRVLHITCYVNRYIKKLKNGTGYKQINCSTAEMVEAENYWIKHEQSIYFGLEIKLLKENKPLNRDSNLLSLNPYLDKNMIMRVTGRLQYFEGNEDERSPIILPKKSRFAYLLIVKAHEELKHSGVNAIMASLRRRFWIVSMRQLVKTIIHTCIVCKRIFSKALSEMEAPLPSDRLNASRAFQITGVDFAGPLYAKDCKNKLYIALFTCAVVRAVHLEITPSLSTEDFLNAFRRFVSRRGVPKVVYSDNAKTFKRSAMEIDLLNRISEFPRFNDFITEHKIVWKNIVERAPWWGGFWERLVRSVKNCLKLSLGKLLVSFDELQTTIVEVEAILNSRPLTYIDDDPKSPLPLTPNSFLLDAGSLWTSIVSDYELKKIWDSKDIYSLWKNRQKLKIIFWKRWKTDYLYQLRSAFHFKGVSSGRIKIGDVYLINDNCPRLTWKMGVVERIFLGRDDKIRACELRLATGQYIKRAIQCLYPIEIHRPAEGVKK